MSGASASRPTGSGIDTLIVDGPTAENRRVDRSSRRHGKGASVPRRPDAELDLDIAGIEELTQDRIDALVEGFLGAEGEFGPIARARRWQVCEGSHLGGQADHGQQLAIQGRVRLGVEAQLKDDRVGCGRGGAEAGAVGDAADEALWPDGRAAGAQQERRAPPAPAALPPDPPRTPPGAWSPRWRPPRLPRGKAPRGTWPARRRRPPRPRGTVARCRWRASFMRPGW